MRWHAHPTGAGGASGFSALALACALSTACGVTGPIAGRDTASRAARAEGGTEDATAAGDSLPSGLDATADSDPTNARSGDADIARDASGGDGGDLAADAAAEMDCEDQLTASWTARPPSVGLASTSSAASYDAVIGGLMKTYSVPGGAIGVVRNGELVFAKGYGWADQAGYLPAHPDSSFRVASLSKQLTAAAILMLVQQGVAHLGDTPLAMIGIAPISGQSTPALATITVSELLQHTGGWNRDATFDPMFRSQTIAAAEGMAGPADCDHVIAYMMSQPLSYAPGSTYDYSNFGYCVLGAYIEKITGTSYSAWVQGNVLSAVGATRIQMGHTLGTEAADGEVVYSDYAGAGLAPSVFPTGPRQVPWPYGGFYLEAMAAHGAWISSPVDWLRLQVRLDGRAGAALLTPASLSQMLANPNVPSGTASGGTTPASPASWYGYGWQVNGAGNWWHTGSLPGTSTEQVHAANGFGWAAFFNTRPANASAFFADLDNALWAALQGATSWLNVDLFDQYGAYTGWMSESEYAASVASQQAAGNYPSRLEGRDQGGVPQFRAVFAPFKGAAWEAHVGLDCLTFRADQQRLAVGGYSFASLQSFRAAQGQRRYQASWVKMQ